MAKMGRPTRDTAPVTIRMDQSMLKAIDDYRREQEDLPSRPEVVRRVMEEWLAARGKNKTGG
ncbi:ribbon-helix-helix protein, CopG family [Tritonibacter scottomollicae]|uniref:Ribbon-helix-helix CopG family protein n=1 Tax=Tritonibacter scottomollicae TaxID=483013 RepID=A0A2T1A292_TRISK|nr:ribbon-helix-helix protein, CopG family [Tritonibacter scottomollicae]PRZ42617.1 ribbon-helix-helix CopG family protein [Tritonibacter scottomollicae]